MDIAQSATSRVNFLIIFLSLFIISGCVGYIPTSENKLIAGRQLPENNLKFIKIGITEKKKVVEQIGEPYLIWSLESLYIYSWTVRRGVFFIIDSGGSDSLDVGRQNLLLIQFDKNDRISRYEKTQKPRLTPLGDFMKEWVENPPAGDGK